MNDRPGDGWIAARIGDDQWGVCFHGWLPGNQKESRKEERVDRRKEVYIEK